MKKYQQPCLILMWFYRTGYGSSAYHVLFTIYLPNTPFPFILYHLLDHLLPDTSSLAPSRLGSRPCRYENCPSSLWVHIYLGSGNVAPSLTQADMPPPGNELLGVLETTRTHVEAVEHRRLVVGMVSMCPLI